MATKRRKLKPAAYAVINAAVFAVCAVTFYQIGKHKTPKPESAAEQSTESSFVPIISIDNTAAPPAEEQTAVTETTAISGYESWESQWRYWDVPWASAYQQLLWTGEYQADFIKNAAFLHTNGYNLDAKDGYRDLMSDIEIYAALIYLDEDDIPELALTSTYHTTIYTYTNDSLELVASIDTLNDMQYYPKKLWLGDHFYKNMGSISYAEIYDFSDQGLKNGAEQLVRLDYGISDGEAYHLYPDEYEFVFSGEWTEIKKSGCLVSSFSPNDAITKLHDALTGG